MDMPEKLRDGESEHLHAAKGFHLGLARPISEAPTLNPLPNAGSPRMPGGPDWGKPCDPTAGLIQY